MSALTDVDPFPFGQHRGEPMAEVPVNYLHWWFTNGHQKDQFHPVAIYIRENLHALELENPDLIWS